MGIEKMDTIKLVGLLQMLVGEDNILDTIARRNSEKAFSYADRMMNIEDPYYYKTTAAIKENIETRYISSLLHSMDLFKKQYQLPSIIITGYRTELGLNVKLFKGAYTVLNEVSIPDYDIESVIEMYGSQMWVLCLVCETEFIELDPDIHPNPIIYEIFGLEWRK
jgi:hypothetical protein